MLLLFSLSVVRVARSIECAAAGRIDPRVLSGLVVAAVSYDNRGEGERDMIDLSLIHLAQDIPPRAAYKTRSPLLFQELLLISHHATLGEKREREDTRAQLAENFNNEE